MIEIRILCLFFSTFWSMAKQTFRNFSDLFLIVAPPVGSFVTHKCVLITCSLARMKLVTVISSNSDCSSYSKLDVLSKCFTNDAKAWPNYLDASKCSAYYSFFPIAAYLLIFLCCQWPFHLTWVTLANWGMVISRCINVTVKNWA